MNMSATRLGTSFPFSPDIAGFLRHGRTAGQPGLPVRPLPERPGHTVFTVCDG